MITLKRVALTAIMVAVALVVVPRAASQTLIPFRMQSVDHVHAASGLQADDGDEAGGNERQVYRMNYAVDLPIIAVGTAWSAFAFTKIYNKPAPTESDILQLNRDDVNVFDRWAIYPYDKRLIDMSNYPFYASIPLPLLFFAADGKTRRDYFKLTLLYWETLSVMGLIGTTSTYLVDRYRPYCYTDQSTMDRRTSKVSKNSFFSGHVEMVAAPTFLIAKVYADYHPDSDAQWVLYGGAAALTGITAFLRLRSGTHFPSDILLGAGVGALCGILVPQFHKVDDPSMTLIPFSDGESRGLSFTYHF